MFKELIPALTCLNEKDYALSGNDEVLSGSTLYISFRRCTKEERATCKSDEEFDKWANTKSVMILHSEKQFQVDKIGGSEQVKDVIVHKDMRLGQS